MHRLGQMMKGDDAKDLLTWIVCNEYDRRHGTFAFKYNIRSRKWDFTFYPEFNMICVAALLQYDAIRPDRDFRVSAEKVFGTVIRVAWDTKFHGFMTHFTYDSQTGRFTGCSDKSPYTASYIALCLFDCYDATHDRRYLEWAKRDVTVTTDYLWDNKYGGWFPLASRDWRLSPVTTKFTQTNANMIQTCYRLYLASEGSRFLSFAERVMRFTVQHLRAPDGGWYRHTTRDGSDPARPPMIGDGGATEPGTPEVYDRMMQMIVAATLGWRATHRRFYLCWIDETLDTIEKTHITVYPAGVNYGYMRSNDYENTWCHLWGLKASEAIARIARRLEGSAKRR